MLRLPGRLQHAHQQWFTCRTLIAREPKLVQLRCAVPFTPATNRLSTSSITMDAPPSNAFQGLSTLDDAIRRTKGSSEVQAQKRAVDLPDIPPIPARKRTFHLSHEELETHVRPLLSCHWHIGSVAVDQVMPDDRQTLTLNKLFTFKNFGSSVQFFDELVGIQNEEDHHARITVDYSRVYVSVHTHCAYEDATPTKVSGLSARDIRFAARVEGLHEKFLDDGRAVTKVPVDCASLEAWSMERLQKRYPASRG